jgi:alpha-beta hydrolase superfamily lysophospholipase
MLYKSTVQGGATTAVSGFVVAPKGRAPASGRPVLAWAHGTTGGATWCAPSTIANPAQNFLDYFSQQNSYEFDIGVPALTTFLREGYVVAATDYQGLGTPGVHQYLVGSTEAHSVLDSILAARQIPGAHAGTRAVVLGWSQGGGAAIFSNQAAAYGAPVRVLGSVDLAPAAGVGPDLEKQVPPNPNATPASIGFSHSELINYFRGMHAAYPELRLSQVLTPVGLQLLASDGQMCSAKFGDVVIYNHGDSTAYFKMPVPRDWLYRINQNTAGDAPPTAPSLVIQGTKDTAINPYATTAYVHRACRFSQPVEYTVIPGAGHISIVTGSQNEYVAWIASRFAGKRAPSNCK